MKSGETKGKWRHYGWFDYLLGFAEAIFHLPTDAFTDVKTGFVVPGTCGTNMLAIFARFGDNGHFKARPRKEREFWLRTIKELIPDGPKLGVRPVLLHSASPSWAERIP